MGSQAERAGGAGAPERRGDDDEHQASPHGGRLFVLVLGVVLLAIGGSVLLSAGRTWALHVRSASWTAVPADLIELKVQTTRGRRGSLLREVLVRYRYSAPGAGGETHVGARLSADVRPSSGAHPLRWHARLAEARARGGRVTALVDPGAPARALLVREVTGPMRSSLLFGAIFALGGVGCVGGAAARLVAAGRWRRARVAHPGRPWRWANSADPHRIDAGAPGGLAAGWIVVLVVNGFVSLFSLGLLDEEAPGRLSVGFACLLQIGGFVLLGLPAGATLRRLRTGRLTLILDEVPVVPGRTLAGALEATRAFPATRPVTVTLRVERSRQADDREKTLLLYEARLVAHASPAPRAGARVPFRFELPQELPAAGGGDDDGDGAVVWSLRFLCEGRAGAGLYAFFPLPVYAVDARLVETRSA